MSQFTADEGKELLALFETMEIRPTGKTPAEMRQWMKDFCKSQEEEPKKEEKVDDKAEDEMGRKESATMASIAVAASAASAAQQVRLPTFSGDDPAKGEATFDLWKYDVDCLIEDGVHTTETIRHAIRRSLKGQAAAILQRMGTNPPIHKILRKLGGIYGSVDAGQTTLAEFYAAKQKAQETVASWSVRLEEILDRAVKLRVVDDFQVNEMLRSRLWAGLQPRLRDAARNKYDTITDFDQLRVEIRKIEREYKEEEPAKKPEAEPKKTAKMATVKKEDETDTDLKAMMCQIAATMQQMQEEMKTFRSAPNQFQESKGQQGKSSRKQEHNATKGQESTDVGATASSSDNPDGSKIQFQGGRGHAGGDSRGCFKCGDPTHWRRDCPHQPVCHLCGQKGHVQKYCYFNLNRK